MTVRRPRCRRGLALVSLVAALLPSCAWWANHPGQGREPEQVVAELVHEALRPGDGGRIATAGFRDEQGSQSAATRRLDDCLASVLVEARVSLAPVPDSAAGAGSEEELLRSACGEGADRVLLGRLRADSVWAYARLSLVECGSGRLLGMGTRRLAWRALQPAGRQREPGGQAAAEVDLHLLCRREEGGFARLVPVAEGGTLLPGDQLQIRFRVTAERQAWAFLYSSSGERVDLFAAGPVYPGRMQFGPGEEQWITPDQGNQVYTLYFVAAPYLSEEQGELFERLAAPIGRGEVDRFTGLASLDQELARWLGQHLQGSPPVAVGRGPNGVALGKAEKFILADGTSVQSRPERLRAAPVLVRALSFAVQ